jgi:hypothetical protein
MKFSRSGVGGFHGRKRKREAVNLRRDSPSEAVIIRLPLPFRLPPTLGGSSRG